MKTPTTPRPAMQRRFFLLLPALLLGGCMTSVPHPASINYGKWGGTGMELELTATGGQIRYDCASGTISETLHPDTQGYFVAQGTHTRHTGAALPEHLRPLPEAVTYHGQIHGNTLNLQVRNASGEDYGNFHLQYGQPANLRLCL